MAIGVAVLSFAKRREAEEPNPVNKHLGWAAEDIIDNIEDFGEQADVVCQWEVERQLDADGYSVDVIVSPEDASLKGNGKRYLDTQDLLDIAFRRWRRQGITDVVIVANKFLHLQGAQKLATKAGFNVLKSHKIPWVGFDSSSRNLQWWCKGPVRLVVYLGIQVFGKLTNQNLHGIGERDPAT